MFYRTSSPSGPLPKKKRKKFETNNQAKLIREKNNKRKDIVTENVHKRTYISHERKSAAKGQRQTEGVFLVKTKNVFVPVKRDNSGNIYSRISTVPRGSERSE